MIEGHIFVDAYFIDEERKTVDALYFDPQKETYHNQIIVAEEGDSEWERFLKTPIDKSGRLITLEDLYERTYQQLQEQKEIHKRIVLNAVSDPYLTLEDLNKTNLTKMLDVLFSLDGREDSTEEENRERLFLLKLATFEWDKLKDADKDFKKNIRKAKDVHEVLSLILNHLKK
tara:strand:+ start:227 stop:745 length:519 start_codon:yes stop_codon:yes gene_type:complete